MNLRVIFLDVATVLSSFTTLLCCALPALLVSIGAGAALAGLVSAVPQLVWISEHKIPVFALAGLMLVISGISTYRGRLAPCPTDPAQAQSCLRLRRLSAWVLGFLRFFMRQAFLCLCRGANQLMVRLLSNERRSEMKKAMVNAGIVAVLFVMSAVAAEKTTCRITGRTMDECCCEMKSGKFYCKFTKQTYDQCCCDMK